MVKNTQGGSSHKKFARKFNTGGIKNNKLRVSEDEGEIYGLVIKMLGNNMFHCHCMDGTIRLGHIRGKFTGRGKRDNMVECGKWVLIGLREWDISEKSSSKKMQQCDLLEIYSDADKLRLRESVLENWKLFDSNDSFNTENEGDVIFGSDRDFERDNLIREMNSAASEKIVLNVKEKDEEEINFEDI
jgi:initiation factor 1A